MPDRDRTDHRSDVLKGSDPPASSCPSSEHGISEYLRLSEEREKESRDEAKYVGFVVLVCLFVTAVVFVLSLLLVSHIFDSSNDKRFNSRMSKSAQNKRTIKYVHAKSGSAE